MSWESVKGFCRRRTQQLKESFQGAPKTEDAEFDAFHAKAEVVVGAAERMSLRLAGVMRDLTDFIQQYELLFIDLSTISTGDHGGAELQGMDKKVELAAQDYKQKFALLEAAIKQVLGELQRFNMEASQVEGLLDDRKAKMLEYDFFRNKLVALRAAPPADTTRIPRNEGRELDWQRAYEESNTQAKKLFQHLIQSGGEIIAQGATVLTVDVSKFFGEVSKTQRVLFLGNRLADGAQAAAASVHNAAVSAVQQVAGQATAVAAGAAVAVHATGNQGSRMDAIKGLARRATQSLREKVSNADSTNDDKLNEVTKKVRNMEKSAVTLSDKVLRAAKLIEELGAVMRDIGEEYKQCPDLSSETQQLADDTVSFGATLVQKAQEHQAPLKEHAFDLLGNFIKDLHKLRDTEEDRKKKQLEYDFFRQKVLELRKSPPKDFTRIPRNEQILENWRTELWKSTEANKSVASTLYAQGQRAIDQSVLTVGQVLSSFLNIAASGAKHSYSNARLPLYPTAPILTPAPLPPNPLPPFQYPNTSGAPPAAVTYTPSGQDYSSPNPHQSQQQWNPSHQPTGQQQPWQHQQQQQQPQQYNQQPPPQQQHQQPPMQQQQQQQLPAAWAQPQQPQQHQQPQHDVPQWATTQQQPVWQPPPQQHQAQHDQAVPHQHPPSQPTSVSSRADSQHSPPPQAATAPVEAQPTAPEAQHAS